MYYVYDKYLQITFYFLTLFTDKQTSCVHHASCEYKRLNMNWERVSWKLSLYCVLAYADLHWTFLSLECAIKCVFCFCTCCFYCFCLSEWHFCNAFIIFKIKETRKGNLKIWSLHILIFFGLGLWCLTSLSTVLQLYRDS